MKKSPAFMPKVLLAVLSVGAITSCATSVSGNRAVAADGRSIHRADQLDEFFLEKPVEIRGLGAKAALEKLDREYRETCRKAGEVPLDLKYEVPAGYERPLNFQAGWTFEHAVSEIAATSGLELKRRGTTFHFQAPKENDRLTNETYAVPPDFLSRISREAYEQKLPVRVAFEKRGVSFDESTRLTLSGTKLGVETRDRGDEAAISGTVDLATRQSPKQVGVTWCTFKIPAGCSWKSPANGIASDRDLTELRGIPGVQEWAPEQWGPCGARFNELLVSSQKGGTLRFQGYPLGLGLRVKAEFGQSNRVRKPVVIAAEGQIPDGGTRVATATRADGTQVLLAVTSMIIDATGRPVRDSR